MSQLRHSGIHLLGATLASVVGDEAALAVVQEHEMVAPRVSDNRALPDRYVEGRDDDAPARGDETLHRGFDRVHCQVGLGTGTLRL